MSCPGHRPTGGDGTYAYEWRSSTNGVDFNTVVGTEQNYLPVGLTSDTWYKRTVTSGGCIDIAPEVDFISIIPGPDDIRGYRSYIPSVGENHRSFHCRDQQQV